MGFGNFRKALVGGALLAASMVGAAPAFAGVVVDYGFIPFVSGGSITFTGSTLGSATSIDFSHVTSYAVHTVGSDDQTGAFKNETINLLFGSTNPITNFTLGAQSLATSASGDWTKTWNTTSSTSCGGVSLASGCTKGSYSATFNSLFVYSNGSNALNWIVSGTLTLPGGATQPDFLSAAFTSVGGNSVNVSFTQTSTQPIISTPEPASMGIVGLALAGLGFVRRRKGKAG